MNLIKDFIISISLINSKSDNNSWYQGTPNLTDVKRPKGLLAKGDLYFRGLGTELRGEL